MTSNAAKYHKIAEDADYLREQYREEKRPITDIADEYGVAYETMRNAFEEASIEVRSRGGGSREPSLAEELGQSERLERWYLAEYLTPTEIAEREGVSYDTVHRALNEAPFEKQSVAERIAATQPLEQLYHGEHLSTYKLGERFGVSRGTANRALELADVPRRPEGWQIAPPTAEPPFEKTELAYLAGLIDGEGHLSLHDAEGHLGEKYPKLWVKMGAEDTIKSLTDPFGGSVWCEQRDDEYADMWKWQANRIADIWTILMAVRPYLRHKASEADEVLEHIRENQAAYISEIDA